MLSDDTNSQRHITRLSSKNCDLQFAKTDIFKENDSIDYSIDVLSFEIRIHEALVHERIEWFLFTEHFCERNLGLSRFFDISTRDIHLPYVAVSHLYF